MISPFTAFTDFQRPVIDRAPKGAARQLKQRLLRQAGVGHRGRFPGRRLQHVFGEEIAQQADDFQFRHVAGVMAGHDIAHEIIVESPARLLNDPHQIRRHQQELVHRGDVDHLGMHGDQHRRRGVERAHREKPELWRTINDDNVEFIGNLVDRRRRRGGRKDRGRGLCAPASPGACDARTPSARDCRE